MKVIDLTDIEKDSPLSGNRGSRETGARELDDAIRTSNERSLLHERRKLAYNGIASRTNNEDKIKHYRKQGDLHDKQSREYQRISENYKKKYRELTGTEWDESLHPRDEGGRWANKDQDSEFALGMEVEREHADTIAEMRSKIEGGADLSDDEVLAMIVQDHLEENQTYYSDMKEAGVEKAMVVDLTEINKDEWWKGVGSTEEKEAADDYDSESKENLLDDIVKLRGGTYGLVQHDSGGSHVKVDLLTDDKRGGKHYETLNVSVSRNDIKKILNHDEIKNLKISGTSKRAFDSETGESEYTEEDRIAGGTDTTGYDESAHPRDERGQWTNKDERWSAESYQQALKGLGGSEEAVIENLANDVDDAPQFAKWLSFMAEGGSSNKEGAEVEFDVDDENMLTVLRDVLSKKGIDIPHPATRMASPGEGNAATWKQPPAKKPAAKDTGDYMLQTGPGALMLGKEYILKDAKIDFSFACNITKSETTAEGKLLIHGVASDTREDKDGEEMSDNAMKDMLDCIKGGNVVILPSHKAEWDEEMGRVVDGKIEDGELHITAELDAGNDKAQKLMKALSQGKQIGLSIGGTVKKVFNKAVGMLGKFRKVIDGLELKHIAVTGRPANPRTWISAISKSIDLEVEKYVGKNQ